MKKQQELWKLIQEIKTFLQLFDIYVILTSEMHLTDKNQIKITKPHHLQY